MKTQPIKIYARDSLYIRSKALTQELREEIRERYTMRFYEDKACNKCEHVEEKHSDLCDVCPAYKGAYMLSKDVKVKEKKYITVPFGDKDKFQSFMKKRGHKTKYVPKFKSDDDLRMRKRIKFLAKLRDYQPKAVAAVIEGGSGVLKAPPRSGKCIVGGSLVMTSEGLHPIKDMFSEVTLGKGETIVETTKKISTVNGTRKVSHLYSKVVDSTIRVSTHEGYGVRGTPNHPVRVIGSDLRLKWVRLEDVKVGDYIVVSRREQWLGSGNELLPHAKDYRKKGDSVDLLEMPVQMSEEFARLLGYWVANGALSIEGRLGITTNNSTIREDFVRCVLKVFPGLDPNDYAEGKHKRVGGVTLHSKQAYRFVRDACGMVMGRAAAKAIPEVILKSDKKYLLAFLSAYVSSDSWIHEHGIQLCTASRQLADELHTVLTYLGVIGRKTRSKGHARNGSGIVRNYYNIHLHASESWKLMKQLTILKDVPTVTGEYVNHHDYIPYGKDFLRGVQDKYQGSNHMRWLKGKKEYSKSRTGGLLYLNKKGLSKGGFLHRNAVSNVNRNVLRWLSPKRNKRFDRALNPDLFFSKVTSVKKIEKPVRVYDVCVPKGHQFIANGIVNHNTVMGTAAICKLGVKTLILASQRDWLMGFYETFCGSKTQTAMTNAVGGGATVAEQRAFKKTGKKAQVAFCKTLEDFENADVCLATVQTFHSEAGQKLLKKIKAMFGLIIVDEIQYGAASKYASILSKFVCPRKVGLTGTDSRKDQKFIIVRMLLGENLFEVKVKRLRPRIRLTRTKFVDNSKNFNWVRFVTKLEMDKARQKLIAEQAIKDMKAGHLVLIPFARVKATLAMVQLINKKVGKRVAAAFIGAGTEKKGESRDDILQKAREYKIKILVGTAKILSVGVNIPRASALFDVSPSSNLENCTQRTSRVLTPMDDKPDPIVRYFLDDSGVRKSCMANEYWKCVHPTFKPVVSEKDMEVLKGYFSRKKESDFIDL